ncbi:hypothetical protein CERZMDRAFT_95815 [Cercospora zeae-maydis SCOH1-5]|uniref:Uncharacterized protein n=1 Tax=Cercospora zeae-maydis SCOH1-5 TaxID=717836 RepID=A0A6A6FMC1_9PEZI|nr:hypothetical protein CERZMDRAFT_95815 [Cercospora zeae-maydis SCOH1-5]
MDSNMEDADMRDYGTGDFDIAIQAGGSNQPALVTGNQTPKPDGELEIAHTEQLVTAIGTTLRNPKQNAFATRDEFWTAVLSSLNPKHEIFQSLKPLGEIPKFYNKFKKQGVKEYGAVADLEGKFGTKGKMKVKASHSKSRPAGVSKKKAKGRKRKPAKRSAEEQTARREKRKEKRAVQKRKRNMFNLRGLGEALPEIEV